MATLDDSLQLLNRFLLAIPFGRISGLIAIDEVLRFCLFFVAGRSAAKKPLCSRHVLILLCSNFGPRTTRSTHCATLTITIFDEFWRLSCENVQESQGTPMRNRILSLLFIGLVLLGIAAPARAQTTAVDPSTLQYQALAGEAARNILTLAGSRDFTTMYDLMHPDSKAVAPRSAVVGLFDAAYSQAKAGMPQVINIEIVDYTWPVTGKTYSPAAKVTFVQPIVDQNGQQTFVQDSIYLAPDADGTWGWFFGNSAAMVQSAIDTYGNSNTAATTGSGTPARAHHAFAGW